jgi:hypothetical protein
MVGTLGFTANNFVWLWEHFISSATKVIQFLMQGEQQATEDTVGGTSSLGSRGLLQVKKGGMLDL